MSQWQPPAPYAEPQAKPKRPLITIGAVLLVSGLLLAGLCGGIVLKSFISAMQDVAAQPERPVPVATTVDLEPGKYSVYERISTIRLQDPGALATSYQTSVTGSDGQGVNVHTSLLSQTLEFNGRKYYAKGQFTIERAGSYRISVTGPSSKQVVIGKDPFASTPWAWLLGLIPAGLTSLTGLILLIVGLMRRTKRNQAIPPVGPPAAPMPGQM